MVASMEARQKITPKINSTMILAIIICVLVTGIVRKFLKVSLSRSIKNSIAAMTPMIHGKRKITPYPITILNNPSKRTDLFGHFSNILGVAIRKVMGIGNKKADKNTSGMIFFSSISRAHIEPV